MISCPHCNATISADLDNPLCGECGRPLVPGVGAQPDRWDALRWSVPPPSASAARESTRPGQAATSVDLLKSLLVIATSRASEEEEGAAGSPTPHQPAEPECLFPPDENPVQDRAPVPDPVQDHSPAPAHTRARAHTPAKVDTAVQDHTPAQDHTHGTIAAALDSLRDRVQSHQRGVACVVDMMTLIASTDGPIDQAETDAVTSALGVLLGGNPKRNMARLLIQSSLAEIGTAGGGARIHEIAQVLNECGAIEQGIIAATAIAYASYGLSPVERALIRQLGTTAGLDPERIDALIRMVRAEVDPA